MVALLAEFEIAADTENRRTSRRKLKLVTDARYSAYALQATIEDLSRYGMLLDSPAELSEGDSIDLELPQVGSVTARIVWTRGSFAGCEFVHSLPQSAVSASLLLSPHSRMHDEAAATFQGKRPQRDLTGFAVGMLAVLSAVVLILILGMLIA